jgi:hypothetical protein
METDHFMASLQRESAMPIRSVAPGHPQRHRENDYPFFPILICRDAMCGKAAAQITRHQVGVTTRKCANCPVREAATMLARSAIHVLK